MHRLLLTSALTAVALTWACGSAEVVPPPPTVVVIPRIDAFTTTPVMAAPGERVELAWEARQAEDVRIVATPGGELIRTAQLRGTQLSAPLEADTTFLLTARHGEVTASFALFVQVKASRAPTIEVFAASSTVVDYDGPVTLTWATTDASSVDVVADGREVLRDGPSDGSVVDTPTAAMTRYQITARGVEGTATAMVLVRRRVPLPVIQSFEASESVIELGATSTLTWDVMGADTTITVTASAAEIVRTDQVRSSVVVQPAQTTAYVLTARNADGQVTATVTVEVACRPLEPPGQQGCSAGEKCTWIEVGNFPEPFGKLGCVPDGAVGLGALCERGAVGERTGYDDCVAGSLCVGARGVAVCQALCGLAPGAPACTDSGSACTAYAGFATDSGAESTLGICNPTCDPLTQTRIVNGQPESCGVGQGCYPLRSTDTTVAICGAAGVLTHNQTIFGAAFANSCAPGHIPRPIPGQTGFECAALCKPADVYRGHDEDYEGGDSRVTNWLGRPATCESAGGPTVVPDYPVTGEECLYFWKFEATTSLTPFSNTLGRCFNHASEVYDVNGANPIQNPAPYPRCTELTTGDVVPPLSADGLENDALSFGCMARPIMLRGVGEIARPRRPAVLQPDRMRRYDQ